MFQIHLPHQHFYQLGIYDNFKTFYWNLKNRKEINQCDELLAAAISGGITGLLTSPLDNIKTKLMADVGYSGFFDCLSKTPKTGGMKAFFAGSAAPGMAYAFYCDLLAILLNDQE